MLALREKGVKIGLNSQDREVLERIGIFFARQKIDAYLVGGFWRDLLLDRPTSDIDIAIAANSSEVTTQLAQYLKAKHIVLDNTRGIHRLILPTTKYRKARLIDIATIENSLEENLAGRDFTINAIAVAITALPLKEGSTSSIDLIDPLEGLKDLADSTIRVTSAASFKADPLRLLRAVRFSAELGFSITLQTQELIKKHGYLIKQVASERVREELVRLFSLADCEGLWISINNLGLVDAVFPELEECRHTTQPREHLWNVLDHSLRTIDALDFILHSGSWEHATTDVLRDIPYDDATARYFEEQVSGSSTRRSLVKLAALIHDIAKPQTKVLNKQGRIRFIGHPNKGEEMTTKLLKRLRFSTREIKMISTMVKYHLRPVQMSQHDQMPTERAVYRYFRDAADCGIETLYLSLADHLATRGSDLESTAWQHHVKLVGYILKHRKQQETIKIKTKLVKGSDILERSGLKPGPYIKELLEAVEESRVAGEIKTKKEAFRLIDSLVKESDIKRDKC